jgi:glucose/mannose transport system substrate-binding protein
MERELLPGEQARIRHLLLAHRDGITRYLSRLGVASAEIDDVAQEVFLVAASKLDSITCEGERSFLYAIASRVALNARRAHQRRHRAYERFVHAPPDPVPTQEELTDRLRAQVLLDGALTEMSCELRSVFVWCEIEGLPVPEVAQRLGVPTGTVASRLRRAREGFFDHVSRARRARRPSRERLDLEVMSWWVSDGEVDAIRALIDIYRRCHPNTAVLHGGIRGTSMAKEALSQRMTEGMPPDTFQTNGGYDLMRWGEQYLEPLEFLFESEQWRSIFPADVLELLSHGGEAYAVPLNIHRTNAFFFDPQALSSAGLEAPRTLDDLHAAIKTLRRKGFEPLSLGTRQPWVLSLLAFENLLVAVAGASFYRRLFQGAESPRAPEVHETLEQLGRLLDACNRDAGVLSWDEAADRVRTRSAAMTIIGDWAKGYLERRGCFEHEGFCMRPTPGTGSTFVFTMDTFALPKAAPHRDGALDLLRVFGSPHGQSTFNRIKGSLPARSDVLPARSDFESATRVPTLTSLIPASFSLALDTALAEFARERDPQRVMAVIEREQSLIRN